MVELALPGADAATIQGVLAAVTAREAEVSTAMGGGLAVPHGRTDLVSQVRVSAGVVDGVPDYLSPDGIPVQVALLVLTPVSASGLHVRILASIAKIMHQPASRAALVAARTPEEFVGVVRLADGLQPVPT